MSQPSPIEQRMYLLPRINRQSLEQAGAALLEAQEGGEGRSAGVRAYA